MGPVAHEILNRNRQVVVGIHQSCGRGDNTVTIHIRIISKGDIIAVLQIDKAGHGKGGGTIHADAAVFIDGHEPEIIFHRRIDHLQIKFRNTRR